MTAKFWITGTGNWSDNTHWSTSTGGANNTTAAGSSDTATFDGASGGGTVTIDGDLTLQAFTWGAFTGTIDNSANHNVTITTNTGFSGTGAGARTFTGGTGTYTLSAAAATWSVATSTNLTNPTTAFASCTVTMSGVNTSGNVTFSGGTLTYGTVNLNANKGANLVNTSGTIATLNITGPNHVRFAQGSTLTITNAFAWTGTSSSPIMFGNSNPANGVATITTGSGTTNTAAWSGWDHITFTPVGGSTLAATNSLDFGLNSGTGFTITAPSAGGGISKARIGSGF